jgi:hypothetical protein
VQVLLICMRPARAYVLFMHIFISTFEFPVSLLPCCVLMGMVLLQTGHEYAMSLLSILSNVTDQRVITYTITLLDELLDCAFELCPVFGML